MLKKLSLIICFLMFATSVQVHGAAPDFKKYKGDWYTDAYREKSGLGLKLNFSSTTKGKIKLFAEVLQVGDPTLTTRVSDTPTYNITFDKNGIGKFGFTDGNSGEKGTAIVSLKGLNINLEIKYLKKFETALYPGKYNLVRSDFVTYKGTKTGMKLTLPKAIRNQLVFKEVKNKEFETYQLMVYFHDTLFLKKDLFIGEIIKMPLKEFESEGYSDWYKEIAVDPKNTYVYVFAGISEGPYAEYNSAIAKKANDACSKVQEHLAIFMKRIFNVK
ncbi:hypothetical protein [Pseudoneobacillus sp. C159]